MAFTIYNLLKTELIVNFVPCVSCHIFVDYTRIYLPTDYEYHFPSTAIPSNTVDNNKINFVGALLNYILLICFRNLSKLISTGIDNNFQLLDTYLLCIDKARGSNCNQ